MLETINAPGFWIAVLQIVMIDIVLSGDNAVVIALACRNLPAGQRRAGIFWGVVGAVGLRVVLTFFAVGLLGFPWLKLAGSLLLLWIGVQLLVPEDEGGPDIEPASHLFGAIRTIIVADFVMSLDNVIGVAAAAKGSAYLLAFGLIVSIPLIVWSSQLILKLMERFPAVVVLGAGLLGWVAGEMMVGDLALKGWIAEHWPQAHYLAPAAGALLVVLAGKWLERRAVAGRDITVV
ncbi:MAG: TerC family protein [Betaproteobacteria bacterium]|nr:TerC family protein [Betaproteobacteria bacterium]